MDFRRNGSRDERRRRVLMEEAAGDTPGDEATAPARRSRTKASETAPSPYAGAAWEEGQPRITALLPLRRLTLWLWLVAYISSVCRLEPGDVLFTGTPPGVGMARKPPVFLKPGDVAEVEIDGLGTLRNPVVAEV